MENLLFWIRVLHLFVPGFLLHMKEIMGLWFLFFTGIFVLFGVVSILIGNLSPVIEVMVLYLVTVPIGYLLMRTKNMKRRYWTLIIMVALVPVMLDVIYTGPQVEVVGLHEMGGGRVSAV